MTPAELSAWRARPLFWSLLVVAQLAVALVVLLAGYELRADSRGYLDGAVFRTPLYPLLLASALGVFGQAGLAVVFVAQVLLALTAVSWLALKLRHELSLSETLTLVMVGLLNVPIVALRVANGLTTEAVAYALLLITAGHLVRFALHGENRPLLLALASSGAAVLTRPQFLFLFAVTAILVTVVGQRPVKRGARALPVAALVAALLATTAIDVGYRYLKHGRFTPVPFTGIQLLASALYLSSSVDAERLSGKERELFVAVHPRAAAARALVQHNPHSSGVGSFAAHYGRSYNTLVWDLIVPTWAELEGGDRSVAALDYVRLDRATLPLALTLMRVRPLAIVRLYLANVASRIGVTYGLVLLVSLAVGAPALWRPGLAPAAALAVMVLLHFTNYALVATVEPLFVKYTFYTDFPTFGLLVVFIVELGRRRAPCAA